MRPLFAEAKTNFGGKDTTGGGGMQEMPMPGGYAAAGQATVSVFYCLYNLVQLRRFGAR